MVSSRSEVLKLYKMLLRESSKFSSYNFRMYTFRRIKSRFHENKDLKNSNDLESIINEGKKSLEVIRRQVILHELYKTDKLIIETKT